MPGYENRNVSHMPIENVYDENADLMGPDYNYARHIQKQNGWNWLCRLKNDSYPTGLYVGVALSAGLIHAWLFQHCVFQWVPTMTRSSRLPLFAVPTCAFWYYSDKYLRTSYGPQRQDKHTMHQILNRVANSARYEAYKQQVEGLVGERSEF